MTAGYYRFGTHNFHWPAEKLIAQIRDYSTERAIEVVKEYTRFIYEMALVDQMLDQLPDEYTGKTLVRTAHQHERQNLDRIIEDGPYRFFREKYDE